MMRTFDRSCRRRSTTPDHVSVVTHNYRWRLGLTPGEPKYDDVEVKLAVGPTISVPTITLEGDANLAPRTQSLRPMPRKLAGKYSHRLIKGGIGHNLPGGSTRFCPGGN